MNKGLLMAAAAALFACATMFWVATADAAPTDAERCEAAKLKAAGKYHFCLLKAERKAVLQGGLPDYSSCDNTLSTKWTAAESRFGLDCPTIGDQGARQSEAMTDAADMAVRLSGGSAFACPDLPATGQTTCWDAAGAVIACAGTGHDGDVQAGATQAFTDNGNGTITDQNTGLTWEKLSDDSSIHDRDTTYTWANALAVKVATLNSSSFAGHNDWRLPNVKEMQSIIDFGKYSPSISTSFNTGCAAACTVTTCSCTRFLTGRYWSSTSWIDTPSSAWTVDFLEGFSAPTLGDKATLNHVRAVRGGS